MIEERIELKGMNYIGSKARQSDFIFKYIEEDIESICEPMAGTGQISFDFATKKAKKLKKIFLNDVNPISYYLCKLRFRKEKIKEEEIKNFIDRVKPKEGFLFNSERKTVSDNHKKWIDGLCIAAEKDWEKGFVARNLLKITGTFGHPHYNREGRFNENTDFRIFLKKTAEEILRWSTIPESIEVNISRQDIFDFSIPSVDMIFFDPPYPMKDRNEIDYGIQYGFLASIFLQREFHFPKFDTEKIKELVSEMKKKAKRKVLVTLHGEQKNYIGVGGGRTVVYKYFAGPSEKITKEKLYILSELEQMKKERTQLIEDINNYEPSKIKDKVLFDDWRIAISWLSSIEEGKENFKYSKEQVWELIKKIFDEILRRGKMNFSPENDFYQQVLIKLLKEKVHKAIILFSLQIENILNGKKKAIVKTRRYDTKDFYLLANDEKGFGYIRLQEPKKIDLEDFDKLYNFHLISEEERKKYWNDAKSFYFYLIRDFIPFEEPIKISLPKKIDYSFDGILPLEEIQLLSNMNLILYHGFLHHLFLIRSEEINPEGLFQSHNEVVVEMKKRGIEHRPRTEFDELTDDWKEINEKILLEKILDKFQSFSIAKPYISLVGSTVVEGIGNDIDLLIKEPVPNPILEFRLRSLFPPSMQNKLHFVYDMNGPFTNYIPLYEKKIERIESEIITMAARPIESVKKEAEESKREDRIVPFRYFMPQKAIVGYRENEMYSIPELLQTIKKEDYPFIVDMKFDGARAIITKVKDKVQIQSEDGGIWTERFPTIVEEMKKLDIDEVIFDCEITGSTKDRPHWGRSDVAGYAHATESPIDDSPFVANIHTLLWLNGKDLHKETEINRKKLLDEFKDKLEKIELRFFWGDGWNSKIMKKSKENFFTKCIKSLPDKNYNLIDFFAGRGLLFSLFKKNLKLTKSILIEKNSDLIKSLKFHNVEIINEDNEKVDYSKIKDKFNILIFDDTGCPNKIMKKIFKENKHLLDDEIYVFGTDGMKLKAKYRSKFDPSFYGKQKIDYDNFLKDFKNYMLDYFKKIIEDDFDLISYNYASAIPGNNAEYFFYHIKKKRN